MGANGFCPIDLLHRGPSVTDGEKQLWVNRETRCFVAPIQFELLNRYFTVKQGNRTKRNKTLVVRDSACGANSGTVTKTPMVAE